MEKQEAALALEDDLLRIYQLTDRTRCMVRDVMQHYFIYRGMCRDGQEYNRACIRIEVAQEASEEACEALNALLK